MDPEAPTSQAEAAQAMSGYLQRQRRTHWLLQAGLLLAGGYVAYLFLHALKEILTPLLVALLLAYLLDPAIDRLEAKGLSRTAGIVVLLAMVTMAVALAAAVLVPLVGNELSTFAGKVPHFVARIKHDSLPWIEEHFHVQVPKNVDQLADRFGYSLQELTRHALEPLKGLAGRAMAGAYQVVVLLATLVLIPFFTFFLLRDFDKMGSWLYSLVPYRHRPWVRKTWQEMDKTLSGWIRGQLLVMLILGALYSVGYLIVGIPLGLVIGLLTGLMAIIPYLGAATGFLLALSLAFLDWQGWGQVAGVVAVFGTVQLLDALFITPNILGYETGLNPAVVVLALLGFGKLFGFLGVLLAVPLAGILHVLGRRAVEAYKKSSFFTAETPAATTTMTELTTLKGPADPREGNS